MPMSEPPELTDLGRSFVELVLHPDRTPRHPVQLTRMVELALPVCQLAKRNTAARQTEGIGTAKGFRVSPRPWRRDDIETDIAIVLAACDFLFSELTVADNFTAGRKPLLPVDEGRALVGVILAIVSSAQDSAAAWAALTERLDIEGAFRRVTEWYEQETGSQSPTSDGGRRVAHAAETAASETTPSVATLAGHMQTLADGYDPANPDPKPVVTGGQAMARAIELGAFADSRFIDLHFVLQNCREGRTPREGWRVYFETGVNWFAKHRDVLTDPPAFHEGPERSETKFGYSGEWVKASLSAVATMLEQEAAKCEASAADRERGKSGDKTDDKGAGATPDDPIRITWLRSVVPRKKVRGDASKLALWLGRRHVQVFKIAGRNHAEREALLRTFNVGTKVHDLIKEYTDDGT